MRVNNCKKHSLSQRIASAVRFYDLSYNVLIKSYDNRIIREG